VLDPPDPFDPPELVPPDPFDPPVLDPPDPFDPPVLDPPDPFDPPELDPPDPFDPPELDPPDPFDPPELDAFPPVPLPPPPPPPLLQPCPMNSDKQSAPRPITGVRDIHKTEARVFIESLLQVTAPRPGLRVRNRRNTLPIRSAGETMLIPGKMPVARTNVPQSQVLIQGLIA